MIEHLIFTCPECGSHELRRVERAHLHFTERSILCKEGNYLPGTAELAETEPRGLAGLQCAKCMYPDSCRTSFRWKSWKYLAAHGCLSPDPDKGKEKVVCTVCSLDGRFYRTSVMLKPGEQLSDKLRQSILQRVLKGNPGIVICERDRVEEEPHAELKSRRSLR